MKKLVLGTVLVIASAFVGSVRAEEPIKSIKILVTSPSEMARNAADIAIPIAEIRKVQGTGEGIVQSLIDRYLTPVGDNDATPPGVCATDAACVRMTRCLSTGNTICWKI